MSKKCHLYSLLKSDLSEHMGGRVEQLLLCKVQENKADPRAQTPKCNDGAAGGSA